MPRTKVSEMEERRRRVQACISHHMRIKKVDSKAVAKIIDKTPVTFNLKMREPERFDLFELWSLSAYFGCSITEICGGKKEEETGVKELAQIFKEVLQEVKGQ